MIRVLHVVSSMNLGGTENLLMNLYKEIDRSKIQFDFLVNRPGVFDKEIIALGGRIFTINPLQKSGQIKYTKELRLFLRENKYQIIHSHINKVSGLILECARKEGIPVRIAHSHGILRAKNVNVIVYLYKAYLGRKIHKNATCLLACSHDAAYSMFGKHGKDTILVNNAIDIIRFKYSETWRSEIRKKYGIQDSTILIGCVARFAKVKNHLFLIDIFKEYTKTNNDAKLLLVGEGPMKQKIINKAALYHLQDKVIFAGTTLETEKYYSAFDFFILPSLSEGLGIVLIEAQISGLQCLTSKDSVPIEAKISERLEYISLNEKPETWASHISKSENRSGLDIGSDYDIKKIARKMEKIYLDNISE